MRHVTRIALIIVAVIHLLPVAGVLGAAQLATAYGIDITGPDLEILMRHRALLFGIVAGLCLLAVFRPLYTTLALLVALASVVSFLVLAQIVGGYGEAIGRIVLADCIALAALLVAVFSHARTRRQR